MSLTNASEDTSDAASSDQAPAALVRVGWWALVVLTALLVVNHLVGFAAYATSEDERALFLIFAAFGLFSLVVLLVSYRRLERWAWWAMWVTIVAVALPVVIFPVDEITAFYAGVAVIMAVAQLATRRAFGAAFVPSKATTRRRP